MNKTKLHGIIPPMVTPLQPDGTVDVASLRRLVDFLIDGGVHGIFALGTSGEAPQLSDGQRDVVLRTTVEQAAGRVPVLGGIIAANTAQAIAFGQQAQDAGVDGVVATAPYYFVHNPPELVAHFRAIHAALNVPLVAYNLPELVKATLDTHMLVTLAEEGTIIALKDTIPDVADTRAKALALRHVESFSIFTGLHWVTDLALLMGIDGAVPGLGNIAPSEYRKTVDAVRAGDLDTARHHQERMIRLGAVMQQGPAHASRIASAFGGFKSALVWLGVIEHWTTAAPMTPFDDAAHQRVGDVLRGLGMIE